MARRCSAGAIGAARYAGAPVGIQRTCCSLSSRNAAPAIARCALWTGSNVPPRMPIRDVNAAPLTADFAVAEDDVFLRRQTLEPDRTARVQLVGRDADFGAQAVLVAVGEAGGSVDDHRARIHFAQETLGARLVAGDDGVGVLRAVLGDVGDGLVQALHHA